VKGIRVTFAPEELRQLYPLISGEIGRLEGLATMENKRISDIRMGVAGLRMVQDRINDALLKDSSLADIAMRALCRAGRAGSRSK
jgi:hypothetical protein